MTAQAVMMLSVAPKFSHRLQGLWIAFMSFVPATEPPTMSNQSMPPCNPLRWYLSASAFCGNEAKPGYITFSLLLFLLFLALAAQMLDEDFEALLACRFVHSGPLVRVSQQFRCLLIRSAC